MGQSTGRILFIVFITWRSFVFALNDDKTLEEHKHKIANYCIKPGDLVIDVGANVGNYAFEYSSMAGPSGLVIGYEANPYVFEYFASRTSWWNPASNQNNILPRQKAVSNASGLKLTMKVYENDPVLGSGTVEPIHWNEGRMPGKGKLVEVETEKLDDLMPLNRSLHFIKIDVEGHEYAVIEGAKQLLINNRPVVIFEYGFILGYWEPNTISQMENLGYVCFDLRNDEQVRPGYEVGCTDLLAVPVERLEEFSKLLPTLYNPLLD